MDACAAARVLARVLAAGSGAELLAGCRGVLPRLLRGAVRDLALRPVESGLATSPIVARRQVAGLLAAAIEAEDYAAAVALLATAGRRPDRRAEKILSHRHGFVWICNPKAASRSLIVALRAADPDAVLLRGRTLDEVLTRHPEARSFYRFAFLRHPWTRTYSFYADKHGRARRDRADYRWFIAPYHGVTIGMSFDELCRWLNAPCGSDAFADGHWLSQSLQIATAEWPPARLRGFVREPRGGLADRDRAAGPALHPADPAERAAGRHGSARTNGWRDGGPSRRRYAADIRLGGYWNAP